MPPRDAELAELALLIGENMKRARKRLGMSQEDLSWRAGLNRTAWGQLERGERIPRTDTVLKIAGVLGVEVGELLANVVWRPAEYASGGFKVRASAETEPKGGASR
jgi:transcriptional regulator with XRE-family HTH domain